jgi:hypothetical protein
MFGTFKAEEEEPVYGLTKPLNSWNPLWANLHVWDGLIRDAWLAPRWIDKVRIWFMPQGWRPEGLPANPVAPEITHQSVIRYDTRVPRGLNVYVLANFVGALLLAIGLLAAGKSLGRGELALIALLVLWALLNIGGILDHRRWAFPSELMRLPMTAAILAARLPEESWRSSAQVGLVLTVVAMTLWLLKYRGQFDGEPQGVSRVNALPAPHSIAGVPTGMEPVRTIGDNNG